MALPVAAGLLTSSCIMEDLPECPNHYFARFRYDMNIYDVDAFAHEVGSVDVWLYDATTGELACHASASGEALRQEGFRLPLNVRPGEYNAVVWGNMEDNASFTPLPQYPAEITALGTGLAALDAESASSAESSSSLTPVYHASARVVFTDNNLTASTDDQTVTFSLVKDTNRINVYMVRTDGSPLSESDFTARITSSNRMMAWDNTPSGSVVYRPWSHTVKDNYADMEPFPGRSSSPLTRSISTPKAHLSELSMGRLMADARSRLEVIRNSDGAVIVSLPLEPNLLLYRRQYHREWGEQEYLDRVETYDLTFLLEEDNSWNPRTMIYIQKWATVPVQYVDF